MNVLPKGYSANSHLRSHSNLMSVKLKRSPGLTSMAHKSQIHFSGKRMAGCFFYEDPASSLATGNNYNGHCSRNKAYGKLFASELPEWKGNPNNNNCHVDTSDQICPEQ